MAARPSWLSVVIIAGLASGCVTTREQEVSPAPSVVQAYLDDKPTELRRHFFIAQAQGDRNRVLNDMRLGLASFAMGRDRLAEQLFDDALVGIEAIYADNEEARKARGLWIKEGIKDFKGEPYERAMAYYYRGLLYMKAGDYENARASFKGGMLQDAFAEEEQYRADFALMPFLQGWAAHCSGNESLATEDFKEFRAINKDAPLPRDKDNVLVLVETGTAPVKISDGPRLKIKRSGSAEAVNIAWTDPDRPKDHPTGNAVLLEDIFRQASTRGGRPFDSILEGKAEYKDTADTVGNVALIGAAVAAKVATDRPRHRETKEQREARQQAQAGAAMIGAGLAVIGGLSKLFASTIESQADTRYWDNLSDRVQGLTLSLPDKVATIDVSFQSSGGTPLETVTSPIQRAGKCGLVWARHGSAVPRNPRAPNSVPAEVMASPIVIPAAEAKSKESSP
ncbi:conserved exported protein of unknown function(containing Tetratricopeptide-like helical dommain,67-203) [Magnetospirillum sp. XM-1]|uniref:hypothetical protein n=1 Tax=Magnetospirillum sp. XM-1 TaxID=1663591 RepID=UPI00073DBC3E|nr:hypothetical protein [Magnetospirillum sp. XM-1]CUW40686.1 conserved exported protein of unknown function(containing Tetratricopeptide-like helical dommain,67-203) [Magnetospirillum sp. XM-1]